MFSENGKISLRQLQCLIISDFIVVYILLLPYFFMKNSVCGIILKFLLSFLFGAVVLYFCTLCAKRKVKNGGENVLKILCIFLLIKTLFINGLFINIINSFNCNRNAIKQWYILNINKSFPKMFYI